MEPKDRDIALVFQQYALYPHLSARDNLLYPFKIQKISKQERQHRIDQTAELLKIGHLLDRKPSQLSGGEQQRVALGRAIVRQPRVFLMDEPLSNLDAKLRTHMRTEIKTLQQELGVTMAFVTHDQAEAMTMADRIAVMSGGRLQQLATPDEMYNFPANLFVAEFLGSPPMNILPVRQMDGHLSVPGGWSDPRTKPDKRHQRSCCWASDPKRFVSLPPERQARRQLASSSPSRSAAKSSSTSISARRWCAYGPRRTSVPARAKSSTFNPTWTASASLTRNPERICGHERSAQPRR